MDKDNLLDVLTKIEDTLKKYWSDHEGFMSLQERILSLRMILEEIGEGVSTGESPNIFVSFAEIYEITWTNETKLLRDLCCRTHRG